MTIVGTHVFGQTIKVTQGNLDFLKGQHSLRVKYVYDSMRVGKFRNEKDYIRNQMEKLNKEKSGSGEEWRMNWYRSRTTSYEPVFLNQLSEQLKTKKIKVSSKGDSPYTMVLKTTYTQPGYVVGMAKKDASINVEARFFKSGDPEKTVSTVVVKFVKPPKPLTFKDTSLDGRLEMAYEHCGKILGQYLNKTMP
ncbi:hypothetical protein [Fulvitalea axinellae]